MSLRPIDLYDLTPYQMDEALQVAKAMLRIPT